MGHNYEKAFLEGQAVNDRVGVRLQSEGIDCTVPEASLAKDSSEWASYTANDKDIILRDGDVLEVKEINQHFTDDPSSWPFAEVIVDTVSGYNKKSVKPLAYIFVSKKTGAMLTMPTDRPRNWRPLRKWDQYREIEDDFYFAPKSMLRTIGQLMAYLKNRKK